MQQSTAHSGDRERKSARGIVDAIVRALPVVVAAATFSLFAVYAVDLATYPWDWDPGEWGSIDAARRLVQAPATLYPRGTVIPIPQTYGPTLALLLLPVLRLGASPYLAARLLMFVIALAVASAAYLLIRKRGARSVALLGAALIVAPFNQSFWYLLVRVDGPMIALWLWAAVAALPNRLHRGSEKLPWSRAFAAGALLALAIMTKATAVVLALAMVAGWLLVDRRSALRLAAAGFGLGGVLFVVLQWLTRGGFLATVWLQRALPRDVGQIPRLLAETLQFNWESVVLFLAALVYALRRKDGSSRDGAWILWVGGALMIPFLSKIGAVFNYLLPFLAAQATLLARWLRRPDEPTAVPSHTKTSSTGRLPQTALALVVAFIAARHPFPSPDAQDRSTAEAFFAFVKARGKPILAALPQGAYGVVEQPVEVEHTDFMAYLRAGLPGTQDVVQRVRSQAYRLLIGNRQDMRFAGAPYRPVGSCDLRFYYGLERLVLLVPRSDPQAEVLTPVPGARCTAIAR